MGETHEKRPDGASRRQTRVQKEQKDKRKVRIMAVSIAAALVLLFAGSMFINSRLIRRVLPAVTIGGVNFSVAEFDYYFNTAYSELQNSYVQYLGEEAAAEYLPTRGTALSSQIQNSETGETWADYFSTMALQNMTSIAQMYSAAMNAGFVLPSDAYDDIDSQITSLKSQAAMYSDVPTFTYFLQQVYGDSMNESSLRKIMERTYITSLYNEQVRDSFTYSNEELAAYYAENADTLDNFIFRLFLVEAEPVEESPEYDDYEDWDDAQYDAALEVALAEASEFAAQIAYDIASENDFIAAAKEYNETQYEDPDSTMMETPGTYLGYDVYGEWLVDSTRAFGDVTTVDTDNGTYVIFFKERDKNEYHTKVMRQLLILPESVNPEDFDDGEDDPDYMAAVQDAADEAANRAQSVYMMFLEGGATEDKLVELMPDYSADYTEGGLYKQIPKGGLGVPEIDDWLFAPERRVGDYELIKSEAYGYHIIYVKGYDKKYCDVAAENGLRERDYQAWQDSLEPAEAATRWAFMLRQGR